MLLKVIWPDPMECMCLSISMRAYTTPLKRLMSVDDVGAGFGAQHTVKNPYEDCLMGVQLIRRTDHEVAVTPQPWDNLHLCCSHTTGGRQFKVVVTVTPDEAGAEKVLHLPLVLEYDVHVALERVDATVPAARGRSTWMSPN